MPIESLSDIAKGGSSAFGGGSGDVVGPATSTTNYVPQWSDATGDLLKNGLPVQTSPTDTTAGALLTMGAFGLPTTANYLALPKVPIVSAAIDFNTVTAAGYFHRILGNAAGSRNANHPDGQTAVTADSGVCDYYYVLNHLYDNGLGNCTQIAIPYLYAADTAKATIKMRHFYGGSTWSPWKAVGGGAPASTVSSIPVACSDETTALTAGTGKVTFRMPYAMALTSVKASLTTAQTSGSIFTVDINEGGTSILSTKLTIDNTEKTSATAAAAAVISDTALAADAEITIDIDQIGDGTATGLKVYLTGTLVYGVPIEIRSASKASSASTASLTVSKPTGTVDGDILIAFAASGANAAIASTGWTKHSDNVSVAGSYAVFSKVAASEPASWNFTCSAGRMSVQVVCVSGATSVEAFGALPSPDSGDTGVAASVTTTSAGLLLGGFFNTAANAATVGPAGMTVIDTLHQNYQQLNVYSQVLTIGGATGTRSALWTGGFVGSKTQTLVAIK